MIDRKQKYLPILDPGHGGLLSNVYMTPKSHGRHIGTEYYEGEFTRKVAAYAHLLFIENGYASVLNSSPYDRKLSKRKQDANKYKNLKNTLVPYDCYDTEREITAPIPVIYSIHTNGGGGKGVECFTYLKQSESDAIATIAIEEIKPVAQWIKRNYFYDLEIRTDYGDGDPDKEAKFSILSGDTLAILFEYLFSDNEKELEILKDPAFSRVCGHHIYQTFMTVENKL